MATDSPDPQPGVSPGLLARAREGDAEAIDALAAELRPRLQRWARGRLPRWARDVADTDDLVQDTLSGALRNLSAFEPEHEAAFAFYLRQALVNRVRDEMRRVGRRPAHDTLSEASRLPDPGASPQSVLISRDEWERYERALACLPPREREAIIGRVEAGSSFEDLGALWGKSPEAARKAVRRAILHLARLMRQDA